MPRHEDVDFSTRSRITLLAKRRSRSKHNCPAGSSKAEFRSLTDAAQAPRNASHRRIFYTEGVQAHWRETTVGQHGELVLEGLPFEPGQPVEVLVMSKPTASTTAADQSLRESVLEFREPLEPVTSEDWDALR